MIYANAEYRCLPVLFGWRPLSRRPDLDSTAIAPLDSSSNTTNPTKNVVVCQRARTPFLGTFFFLRSESVLAGTQAVGDQTQDFEHQRSANQCRVAARIKWRCDLNHVTPYEIQSSQAS